MFDLYNHHSMSEQSDRLTRTRIQAGFKTAKEAVRFYIKQDELSGTDTQWKESTYSANESGTAPFSMKRARLYAGAFGVSAEWLYDGSGEMIPEATSQNRDYVQSAYGTRISETQEGYRRKIPLQSVRITHRVPALGKVEAGAWREMIEEYPGEDTEYVDCELPEYKGVEAFCTWVVGESINRFVKPGGKVIWVKAEDAIGGIQQDDYVMVRAPKAATGLFECTVKKLNVSANGDWELWPDSDDPEWQKPYIIPPRIEAAQEGIHVYGVVVETRQPKLRRSGIPAKQKVSA